jgi:nascent polypeptide-associated complex subunit beta
MVVTGSSNTKDLKSMMPEILKQVGPQQYNYLKTIMGSMDSVKEAKGGDEDDDDVPELVNTNFEEASKK